ncbi:hypothetical protein [Chitinibacter sp. S2-10]|uniref:hypothetical protein n=1 Tax=Chitinibacter sp. S2-10 TaxID=3373597 RepID=UPI003977E126
MHDLPAHIKAELAAAVETMVAQGVDRLMARQKVWQNYQNELVVIAETMHSVADRAVPELPPPKPYQQQDLSRHGNKPLYRPRADSGDDYWNPERKAKARAGIEQVKQQLRMK